MKPASSLRPMVLLFVSALTSCALDGKGLARSDAATSDTGISRSGGRPVTGSGGTSTSTGGGPVATGGNGSGGAVGTGGELAGATGGSDAPGTGGAGTGGAVSHTGGTGGALAVTGGSGGGQPMGTGGAGIAGRGGGPGGMGSGGRGTGGAATGGAPVTCSPTTCPNGCCQSGTCVTTNRTDQRCGSGGMACAPCGACFQCSNAGSCTPIENARWDITCVSAIVAATNSGSPWDAAGPLMSMSALPDPYCQLTTDGDDRTPTDSKTDTLAPLWNESAVGRSGSMPTTALLTATPSRWAISVYDIDNSVAEEICFIPGHLTAADLAAGTITYTNKQSCSSLTIKVTCAQD